MRRRVSLSGHVLRLVNFEGRIGYHGSGDLQIGNDAISERKVAAFPAWEAGFSPVDISFRGLDSNFNTETDKLHR